MSNRDIPVLDAFELQLARHDSELRTLKTEWAEMSKRLEANDADQVRRLIALETAPPPLIPGTVVDPLIPVPPTDALNTRDFPGDDLGARINAADEALGDREGAIVAEPGTIATQVHLNRRESPRRTLFLKAGQFPIVNPAPTAKDPKGERFWFGAILPHHHAYIFGEGEQRSQFIEPAKFGYVVIQASEDAILAPGSHYNSLVTNDIGGGHFAILGADNAPEGGTHSTIQLGNAHGFDYHYITLSETSCLGLTAGGNALNGHHAKDGHVHHFTAIGLASQCLNVVNGEDITYEDLIFLRTGKFLNFPIPSERMGVSPLDLEPNDPHDIIRNIRLRRILINSTDSPLVDGKPAGHGNAVVIQNNVQTLDYGPVTVDECRVIGAHRVFTGIYVGGHVENVTVRGSHVEDCLHALYRFEDGLNLRAEDNTGSAQGIGGSETVEVDIANVHNSTFKKFQLKLKPETSKGRLRIAERGTSDFNEFIDCNPKPILVGKNSKEN